MGIRQITIVGTGLIGGSLALALRKGGFRGRIIGHDRSPVLQRALKAGVVDLGEPHLSPAILGSQVVVLATPVLGIIDLIDRLGPRLDDQALLTDVGSTKLAIVERARRIFGKAVTARFLGGHPMAGKEQSGVEFSDPNLFQGATWFVTPTSGQNIYAGISGNYVEWLQKIGARIVSMDAEEHDKLCAWISHLPQMISTALAATLVEEYGADAPLLDAGGRALREMTRVAGSPYSWWRDVAITNKMNLQAAISKLELQLARIRENLDTRELAAEFDKAHQLQKPGPKTQTSEKKRKS
ncbi:MAG TPA: prephenate dehydrogenase/arogenate dehydrogenase family protein [Terriglobales bacterium]|nr:prephenate dehydrogenase/arogenate dehydrogenase family protein [Terriglobales bacterium]HXY15362.1 prephenate dehydrogenase/arogenate dehydrogenase family protein [Terriglobales bacterium]